MKKTKMRAAAGLILVMVLAWVIPTMAGDIAKINLNTATKEQLLTLKGIGENYATRIIEYRKNNGPFQKAEDIMKVKGIGDKIFQSIKDRIIVRIE